MSDGPGQEERRDRLVGVSGALDLRHMAAVKLEMASAGKRVCDVSLEPDGHENVFAPPDEQRVGLECPQARPEPVLSVRLV